MSVEQNKQIMKRMIEEVWNKGNLLVADELFAASHTSPSAPDLPPGPDSVKMLVTMFRSAMPDYQMKIDMLMADEHKVVARFVQWGTHVGAPLMGMPPSGRRAEWTEIGVLEIENGKIVKSWYEVDMLSMIQQLTGQKVGDSMTSKEIIEKYFEYANAGKWDAWCDLFAADAIYEEQLAGHIEGRETLRPMMAGFPQAYKVFYNIPRHFVVEGNQAMAISHITAQAMKYPDEQIEAEATLYLEIEDGAIVFAQNFHDSKPFAPFLRQISEG